MDNQIMSDTPYDSTRDTLDHVQSVQHNIDVFNLAMTNRQGNIAQLTQHHSALVPDPLLWAYLSGGITEPKGCRCTTADTPATFRARVGRGKDHPSELETGNILSRARVRRGHRNAARKLFE